MFQRRQMYQTISLLAVLAATLGCNGLDQVDRRVDIASEHIGTDKPVYQGHLESAKEVGALTSLQFTDGQQFDVTDAPSALTPGDTVRIYKTDKGYEAHLWKESQEKLVPSASTGPVPTPGH